MSYSLALGPFHPAWRGPQRLLLQVDGERVADLEYRDEYNERGCAERLPKLDLPQALYLVNHLCGTCSFAHSLAFCHALEQLCGIAVGERAAYLRCFTAELERAASHVQAVALLLDVLGAHTRAEQLHALREPLVHTLEAYSGSRLIPDMCLPGGVRHDLSAAVRDEALATLQKLTSRLYRFTERLIDHRALTVRVVGVGVLPRSAAEQYGVRGPLARASGIARDARVDHAYAAYAALATRTLTQEGGDVHARMVLLLLEALESVKLAEQALRELPHGAWQGDLPEQLLAGSASGLAEGPRGMIRYQIESDGKRLTNVRIDTPRQLDRLLARTLLAGALVDNVVAIVASCDSCTACAEK